MGRPTMTRGTGSGSGPRPGSGSGSGRVRPPAPSTRSIPLTRSPSPSPPSSPSSSPSPSPSRSAGRPPAGQLPPRVAGRSRFAARARAVRRASWRWKLLLPLLVLLVVGAWWLVYSGPVLVLRNVAVPGVPPTTAEQVRSAARLPHGEQLVRLDLLAAQRRVAAIRTVASAQVSRSWPSTVTISVRLRVPVAVVKDGQGGLHLADQTGTTYAEVTVAPDGLPVVQADASDPAAVQSAVQVLAALPGPLRAQVSSARASGPDSIVLTVGRVTVVWGSAQDSALKVTVLDAIRRANPTARRVDLSAPRSPSIG